MPRHSPSWLLAALMFGALLHAAPAAACSCADAGSPCQLMTTRTPIFVGKVLEQVPTGGGSPRARATHAFRVSVSEGLSGRVAAGSTITVTTASDSGSCGYGFHVGEEYLIYAYEEDGSLWVDQCSRTETLANSAEERSLLREFKTGKPVTRLLGSLALALQRVNGTVTVPQLLRPEPGTVITARGPGGATAQARLDDNGRFVFKGLRPGTYTLKPQLPPAFIPYFGDEDEQVTVDACFGEAHILVSFVGMRGTVTSSAGPPPRQLVLTIARVDDAGQPMGRDFTTMAFPKTDGSWEVRGLPPGRYAVGVNPYDVPRPSAPYGPFWVPASDDRPAPRVFEVTESPAIVDVRLPPPLETVAFRGVVLRADGTGVTADLRLQDTTGAAPVDVAFDRSGPDGRFSIVAIKGRAFRLTATSPQAGQGAVDVAPGFNGAQTLEIRVKPD